MIDEGMVIVMKREFKVELLLIVSKGGNIIEA